jgi:hypothetical protein
MSSLEGLEKSSIGSGTAVSQLEWHIGKNGHLTPPVFLRMYSRDNREQIKLCAQN